MNRQPNNIEEQGIAAQVSDAMKLILIAQQRTIIARHDRYIDHREIDARLGAVLPADHQAGMRTALTTVFAHLLTASPDQLLAMTTAMREAVEATTASTAGSPRSAPTLATA